MSETAAAKSRLPIPGAPAFLFALLLVAVWFDPLFARRNFTGMDLVPYNLPMEKSIHDAYAAGRLPVWSPYISGGRPLLPNPNAGALYPVRPLLSPLPFPAAMKIYPVLHWLLSGAGMLLLLRAIGLPISGAWVGAATYVFSGVSISEVYYPHIQPGMTLLPWILWAVARPAAPARKALGLGALFGLLLLAADVFTSALAMLAAALWLATETERSRQIREFGLLAAGVLLGALVAAPQIVATALWIPETNRARARHEDLRRRLLLDLSVAAARARDPISLRADLGSEPVGDLGPPWPSTTGDSACSRPSTQAPWRRSPCVFSGDEESPACGSPASF